MSQQVFTKRSAVSIIYDMDFAYQLDDGDSILTGTVTCTPGGLSIGTPTIFDGRFIQARIGGGTTRTVYKLTFTATTAKPETLQDTGTLSVNDG